MKLSYCLPTLFYGCEVWSLSLSLSLSASDVPVDKCCLEQQLQTDLWWVFFCQRASNSYNFILSLFATFIIDERNLLSWRKMLVCSNIILRAISCLVRCRSANVRH